MNVLQEYAFTDCLVLQFECDSILRNITLRVEGYFPLLFGQTTRQRKVVEIQLFDCSNTNVRVIPEFWEDLRRPYANGDTYKANEINELCLNSESATSMRLELLSDMMQLEVECARAVVGGVDITSSDLQG